MPPAPGGHGRLPLRPPVLTAQVGTELVELLVDDDTETYRFVVDELDLAVVPSGREAVVRVAPARPGTLAPNSEAGGEHRTLGMPGSLVVSG